MHAKPVRDAALRARRLRAVTAWLVASALVGVVASPASARVPDDPRYPEQYGLPAIAAPAAWDVTTGSASVLVADLGDGVDPGQDDLRPNLVAGYDFGDRDADTTQTVCCHGDQTAAVLAARGDDGIGMAGVAWTVGLMPLKVRTDGPGERFDMIAPAAIADAIGFARARGVRVINASLAFRSSTTAAERDAVYAAMREASDTLIVVSAGNSARDVDARPRYPCSFDLPNLMCVGATDSSGGMWASSNYGATAVDVAAPGVGILSLTGRNRYGLVDGTSYAAPHVSGVAALYFARHSSASVADVRAAILAGADPHPTLAGKTVSGGRLNAARTLAIPPRTSAPGPGPAPGPGRAPRPGPGPGSDPAPGSPPPSAGGPAPGTPRPPSSQIPRLVVRAGTQRIPDVLSSGVRVSIRAPRATRVRIGLRLSRATARRLRVPTLVGSRTVRVSRTGTFRVRLRRSAAKQLRFQRRVALRLTGTPAAGSGVRAARSTIVHLRRASAPR